MSISWELSEGLPDVMGFLFVPVMVNNRLYALQRRPPSGREALAPGRYAAVKGDGGSVDGVWLCGTGA